MKQDLMGKKVKWLEVNSMDEKEGEIVAVYVGPISGNLNVVIELDETSRLVTKSVDQLRMSY